MRKLALVLAAVAAVFAMVPAEATTLIVNGSGRLTGATGVNVNGTLYDVAFIDDTCAAIFSGCDEPADLTFHTFGEASVAGQALLAQVLIDTAAGNFDNFPPSTVGCSDLQFCEILIPYSAFAGVTAVGVLNLPADSGDGINPSPLSLDINTTLSGSTSLQSATVFARFTHSGVPEPATWGMMLAGFGSIGFAMRRRRPVRQVA